MRNLFFRLSRVLAALAALFVPHIAAAESVGKAKPWQMGFQEAVTPVMRDIDQFHALLFWIITGITIFVLALLLFIMVRFNAKANPTPSKVTHNTLLEIIWTAVPVIILIIIVVPSLRLVYFMDKTTEAEMTLKVTGYQWYWGYEYPDNGGIAFESHMVRDDELKEGQPRLLETDNHVVLPVDTNIRILVTAADVLHAWAVPAFGIKKDAVPGKLNETWVRIEKPGKYYGQCSELCGIDHAFMPITIDAVSKEDFQAWAAKMKASGG